MYCRNCGKEIDADARFCPYCGYTTGEPDYVPNYGPDADYDFEADHRGNSTVTYKEKSEFVTILFSFFITGLGHIYVGKTMEGVKVLAIMILLNVLTFFAAMISPYLGLLGFAVFVFWIYAMFDSYRFCKEYNESLRNTGYPPW